MYSLIFAHAVVKKTDKGNKMQGWTGKLIGIDLKTKTSRITSTKKHVLENYIGGKGLVVR